MENTESRYLRFGGIRVHFSVSMPEGAVRERALLVCSPLITEFHWRKLIPELTQQGCVAVAAELPGFGDSDCGQAIPQDRDTRSNILWGILDRLDEEMRAPMSMWHLIGHGSACRTVLRMAKMYPDSVRSQVLLSPLFRAEQPADALELFDEIVRTPDTFREAAEHLAAHPMDDYVLDRMRHPLLRRGAGESFARMLRHLKGAPDEGMGFAPTMVIWGGADPLMTDTALDDIDAMLPEAEKHVLRTAGYFPMETHSMALRDYLRGWLRYNRQG